MIDRGYKPRAIQAPNAPGPAAVRERCTRPGVMAAIHEAALMDLGLGPDEG
jgi:hypothetical protein